MNMLEHVQALYVWTLYKGQDLVHFWCMYCMFENGEGILSIAFPRSQQMSFFHCHLYPFIVESPDHVTRFIVQATLSFARNVACQRGLQTHFCYRWRNFQNRERRKKYRDGNGWKGADNLWSNHQRSQPGVQLQVVLVHETLNQTSHAQHAQDAQDVKFVDFTEPRKRQQVSLPLYHCQKIAFCCQLVATCVAVCCFMFHVVSWCEALVRNQFRSETSSLVQACPGGPHPLHLRFSSERCRSDVIVICQHSRHCQAALISFVAKFSVWGAVLSARSQLRKIVNYDTCQAETSKVSILFHTISHPRHPKISQEVHPHASETTGLTTGKGLRFSLCSCQVPLARAAGQWR